MGQQFPFSIRILGDFYVYQVCTENGKLNDSHIRVKKPVFSFKNTADHIARRRLEEGGKTVGRRG